MRSKKFFLVGFALFLALLTTGCGTQSKTLVCTQKSGEVDIVFNVGFKGNTITGMDFSYDMDLSKYNDTQIAAIEKQDFCSIVKNSMSEYKDSFTNCQENIEEKHLKVSSTLDINKIAKNILQKMASPDATKKELENQGYSCEIK